MDSTQWLHHIFQYKVSLVFCCYQQTHIFYLVFAPKYTYPDRYLFTTDQERLAIVGKIWTFCM